MAWLHSTVVAGVALGLSTAAIAAPVTIHAGQLLDGKGGVARDMTITVDGTKIVSVTPGRSTAATYDFDKLTVLPGLIDTHVHVVSHFNDEGRGIDTNETGEQKAFKWAENLYLTLIGGYTTVQSLGADEDYVMRAAMRRGRLPGPRLLTSGLPMMDPKLTPDEIRAFVDKAKANGADVVKIFASKSSREGGTPTLTDDQINAGCDEARKLGMISWVHAHAASAVRQAILAGCTTVTHARFVTQAELDLAVEHGTYIEPTWGVVVQNYIAHQPNLEGIGNYTKEAFDQMRSTLKDTPPIWQMMLRTKGLKLLSGSDAVFGAEGHNAEEIIWRVQNGQKPMDAIVVATSANAKAIRLEDQIGAIAPGMEADIIAVKGDPLTDIRALRDVLFVMKGGRVYKNIADSNRAGTDAPFDAPPAQ